LDANGGLRVGALSTFTQIEQDALVKKHIPVLADAAAVRAFAAQALPDVPPERVLDISAKTGAGLDALFDCLAALSPEHEHYYPDDCYTDQDVRFRVSEIIREQAFLRFREELPHAVYVDISDCELQGHDTRLFIRAFLYVDTESQKAIAIGRGGSMLRAIKNEAVQELRKIFDWYIDLDISVKVSPGWRSKDAILDRVIS
jgi:GTP-binding protein Era